MGNVIYLEELQSVKNRFTLEGKTMLVTGGAGGIGRSAAAAMAELGAKVALADVKLEVTQKNADFIEKKYGGKTIAIAADVTDPSSVDAMFEKTVSEFGKIDGVFANAGITMPDDSGEMPFESWNKILAVNLTGVFLVNKAAAILMRSQGHGGSVVNTASMSAHIINNIPGRRSNVSYCTTKAGVEHLTKGMAMDFRNDGIRFNSISPGYMYSGLHDNMEQKFLDLMTEGEPWKRFGTMDEIGGLVAFLMTDLASYMTGTDIIIDGGHTCW